MSSFEDEKKRNDELRARIRARRGESLGDEAGVLESLMSDVMGGLHEGQGSFYSKVMKDEEKAAEQYRLASSFRPSIETELISRPNDSIGGSLSQIWDVGPAALPAMAGVMLRSLSAAAGSIAASEGRMLQPLAERTAQGSALGATVGSFGGPAGAAAGAIAGAGGGFLYGLNEIFAQSSSMVESFNHTTQLMQEHGFDPSRKEEWQRLAANPELHDKIRKESAARGDIIGTVDFFTGLASGGVGSVVFAAARRQGASRLLAGLSGWVSNNAVDAGGGMAGETGAQLFSGERDNPDGTKKPFNVSAVMLEGLIELIPALGGKVAATSISKVATGVDETTIGALTDASLPLTARVAGNILHSKRSENIKRMTDSGEFDWINNLLRGIDAAPHDSYEDKAGNLIEVEAPDTVDKYINERGQYTLHPAMRIVGKYLPDMIEAMGMTGKITKIVFSNDKAKGGGASSNVRAGDSGTININPTAFINNIFERGDITGTDARLILSEEVSHNAAALSGKSQYLKAVKNGEQRDFTSWQDEWLASKWKGLPARDKRMVERAYGKENIRDEAHGMLELLRMVHQKQAFGKFTEENAMRSGGYDPKISTRLANIAIEAFDRVAGFSSKAKNELDSMLNIDFSSLTDLPAPVVAGETGASFKAVHSVDHSFTTRDEGVKKFSIKDTSGVPTPFKDLPAGGKVGQIVSYKITEAGDYIGFDVDSSGYIRMTALNPSGGREMSPEFKKAFPKLSTVGQHNWLKHRKEIHGEPPSGAVLTEQLAYVPRTIPVAEQMVKHLFGIDVDLSPLAAELKKHTGSDVIYDGPAMVDADDEVVDTDDEATRNFIAKEFVDRERAEPNEDGSHPYDAQDHPYHRAYVKLFGKDKAKEASEAAAVKPKKEKQLTNAERIRMEMDKAKSSPPSPETPSRPVANESFKFDKEAGAYVGVLYGQSMKISRQGGQWVMERVSPTKRVDHSTAVSRIGEEVTEPITLGPTMVAAQRRLDQLATKNSAAITDATKGTRSSIGTTRAYGSISKVALQALRSRTHPKIRWTKEDQAAETLPAPRKEAKANVEPTAAQQEGRKVVDGWVMDLNKELGNTAPPETGAAGVTVERLSLWQDLENELVLTDAQQKFLYGRLSQAFDPAFEQSRQQSFDLNPATVDEMATYVGSRLLNEANEWVRSGNKLQDFSVKKQIQSHRGHYIKHLHSQSEAAELVSSGRMLPIDETLDLEEGEVSRAETIEDRRMEIRAHNERITLQLNTAIDKLPAEQKELADAWLSAMEQGRVAVDNAKMVDALRKRLAYAKKKGADKAEIADISERLERARLEQADALKAVHWQKDYAEAKGWSRPVLWDRLEELKTAIGRNLVESGFSSGFRKEITADGEIRFVGNDLPFKRRAHEIMETGAAGNRAAAERAEAEMDSVLKATGGARRKLDIMSSSLHGALMPHHVAFLKGYVTDETLSKVERHYSPIPVDQARGGQSGLSGRAMMNELWYSSGQLRVLETVEEQYAQRLPRWTEFWERLASGGVAFNDYIPYSEEADFMNRLVAEKMEPNMEELRAYNDGAQAMAKEIVSWAGMFREQFGSAADQQTETGASPVHIREDVNELLFIAEGVETNARAYSHALDALRFDSDFRRQYPAIVARLDEGMYHPESNLQREMMLTSLVSTYGVDFDRAIDDFSHPSFFSGMNEPAQAIAMALLVKRIQAEERASINPVYKQHLLDQQTRVLEWLQTTDGSRAGQHLQAYAQVAEMLSPQIWVERHAKKAFLTRVTNAMKHILPSKVADQIAGFGRRASDEAIGVVESSIKKAVVELVDLVQQHPLPRTTAQRELVLGMVDPAAKDAELNNLVERMKDLIRVSSRQQGRIKDALIARVLNEPEFAGLDPAGVAKAVDSITGIFEEERGKVFKTYLNKFLPRAVRKKALTKAEKFVQAVNAGALDSDDVYMILADGYGLPEYTPEIAAEIKEMVEDMQDLPLGSKQRAFAHQRIMDFIKKKSGLTTFEFLGSFWYAAVLSGLGTQMTNAVATGWNVGIDSAYHTLWMMGAGNVKSFLPMWVGGLRGLSIALNEFRPIMKEGDFSGRLANEIGKYTSALELVDSESARLLSTSNHVPAVLGSPFVQLVSQLKYVTRLMAFADTVNASVAAEFRSAAIAYNRVKSGEHPDTDGVLAAIREQLAIRPEDKAIARDKVQAEIDAGLLPEKDRNRRFWQIVQEMRPPEIVDRANSYALRASFNQRPEGFLGMLVDKAIKTRMESPILTPLLPFITIPANVANELINHMPLLNLYRIMTREKGRLRGANDKYYLELSPETTQLMRAKVVVSSLMMMTLGLVFSEYQDDDEPLLQLTGGFLGMDREKRSELMSQGIREWSIVIRGKDGVKSIPYKYTPFGLMLGSMGNYFDARRYMNMKEDGLARLLTFDLLSASAIILDMSFLAGITDLLSAASISRGVESSSNSIAAFIARASSGFIPNIFKELDTYPFAFGDPTMRQTADTLDYLQREIPFIPQGRRAMMPLYNILGEEVKVSRTPIRRFYSEKQGDPVWDAVAKKTAMGVFIPEPSPVAKIMRNGKRDLMTEEEFHRYRKAVGDEYRKWLVANLETYDKTSPEEVKRVVYGKIFKDIRSAVRARMRFDGIEADME